MHALLPYKSTVERFFILFKVLWVCCVFQASNGRITKFQNHKNDIPPWELYQIKKAIAFLQDAYTCAT